VRKLHSIILCPDIVGLVWLCLFWFGSSYHSEHYEIMPMRSYAFLFLCMCSVKVEEWIIVDCILMCTHSNYLKCLDKYFEWVSQTKHTQKRSSYEYYSATKFRDTARTFIWPQSFRFLCGYGHLQTPLYTATILNEETFYHHILYVCQTIRYCPVTFEMVW